jgi:hypothetical protein
MARETVQLRGIATGHDVAATLAWLRSDEGRHEAGAVMPSTAA